MNVDGDGEAVTVSGPNFEYVLDRGAGTFTSLRRDGIERLERGPRLSAWRTPIANERVGWGTAEEDEWRAAGLHRLEHAVRGVEHERVADGVFRARVRTTVSAPDAEPGFDVAYLHHVLGTGDLLVGVRAVPNAALRDAITTWLPRIGLRLDVPGAFDEFAWYGRGPHETYPDRKTGAEISVHRGSVADQHVPYVRPQAGGNKADVRWATLRNGDGTGLAAFGHPTANVTASAVANRDRALYDHQLREGDRITLDVDHAVTGVGGTPQPVQPEHRVVPDGPFEFVIGLRPVGPDDDPMALSRRRLPYAISTTDR